MIEESSFGLFVEAKPGTGFFSIYYVFLSLFIVLYHLYRAQCAVSWSSKELICGMLTPRGSIFAAQHIRLASSGVPIVLWWGWVAAADSSNVNLFKKTD